MFGPSSGSVLTIESFQGGRPYSRLLRALTKNNRPFKWNPACQDAFDTLKGRLATAPVLLPRDEGLISLDNDASYVAVGVILSQVQDGEERVKAYYSRLYAQTGVNNCTSRK